ncbi:DUF401 family protein [Chloroflexota bacterium]
MPMIPSSLALILSICLILILIRCRVIPGFAILCGGIALAISVLTLSQIPGMLVVTFISSQLWQLLLIIASALTLSHLLEMKGLLTALAETLESIGPRVAITATPSVIGLVPMPAGALVSAAAVKDLVPRLGLKPAEATFINYWFRHIWEFSLPVYPAIITTGVILDVPLSDVVVSLLPLTALAGLVGMAENLRILRSKPNASVSKVKQRNIPFRLLLSAWPIFLIFSLVLAGVKAWIAFPSTLILVMTQQKARWGDIKSSLRYGLEPKILVLLISVMLYKTVIETSGSANVLIADLNVLKFPPVIVIALLPFLIGLATGFSMAFVGVTFPLLVPLLTQGGDIAYFPLLLAYVSGGIGLLLSPMHLCLMLSTEYFNARLFDVYRHIVPLVLLMEITILIPYLLFA